LISNNYNFLLSYNIMSRKTKKTHLRKTRKNKSYKQKYNMIGCSKKCRCSCHRRGGSSPIGGLPIKGGGCFGPLVGTPYSPSTGGNYYELPNPRAYDVGQNMKLRGGRKRMRGKRSRGERMRGERMRGERMRGERMRGERMRGGSILPDNLVNVGSQAIYGGQTLYNRLYGYKTGSDPAPYVQNKI
jgi:hypothetical protein